MSQNIAPLDERPWIVGAGVYEAAALFTALMLLGVCAIWLQSRLGADTDVHWLVDLAGRWLDGGTPYVDFVEINPPASLLLYVLPTAFAREFGLGADAVTQASVALLGAAELAVAVSVARRAGLAEEFGMEGLFWSAAAIFLLPGFAFGQRDHLALILAAPFFVVLTARALSRPVDAPWAILAGFGAGCMMCLRPHYALALAPATLYAAHRGGWRLSAWLPEATTCALAVAAYATSIVIAFPHFVTDMLPIDVAVYIRGGGPLIWMFAQAWFAVWLLLALALWGARRPFVASVPAQLLALASVGALVSYLLQGKGWPYHIYVADALLLASFAIANRIALRRTGMAVLLSALALASVSAVLVLAFLTPGDTPFLVLRYSLTIASALLTARLVLASPKDAGRTKPMKWSCLGVAVLAVASGEMSMLEGAHPPFFRAEMAELAPRPKIALVSGNGAAGLDLARQTDGIYAPRVFSLNILELAMKRLWRGGLSLPAATDLSRYVQEDRNRLATTVRDDRPDAIVVDPAWAERYLGDAFLRNLLVGYRLRATDKFPQRFLETPTLQLFTREPGP